jgi:hypothetical protein
MKKGTALSLSLQPIGKSLLLSLLFFLVTTACSVLQRPSMVLVRSNVPDSVDFHVNALPFTTQEAPDLLLSFNYLAVAAKKPSVYCEVQFSSNEVNFQLPGLQLLNDNGAHHVSTFDRLPVQQLAKDKFLHSFAFFVPQALFVSLLKTSTPRLLFNEKEYVVKFNSWENVQEEVKTKGLLLRELRK